MVNAELCCSDLASLAPRIRDRQVSPVELAQALLDRIERLDGELHAFITVVPEAVLRQARLAETEIRAGRYRGPLHGIPVAHKDVFWTKGLRTTAHSGVLRDFVPDEDATVVARLAAAGAITLGKANTHEFACGGMDFFGFARNAWDLDRVPGGSSSGPATALAAHLTIAATGSDTGGSIRLPASFSGVVGLKPTYGRIGRYGLTALSWDMDHPGPLTRTVLDAAIMMNALAGYDPRDPSSARAAAPDFTAGLGASLIGTRVGVPREYFFEGLHPEVAERVEAALGVLKDLGAELIEVRIPHIAEGVAAHYVIAFAEAASILEKELVEQPASFGAAAFHRISQGRFFTAAEYLRAMRVRELVVREVGAVFGGIDALVSPTTPYPAYRVDEFVGKQVDVGRFTRLANLTGQPSLSLPCGFTADGLPVGLQLTGRAWDEVGVLRIARAYEQSTPWHSRRAAVTHGAKAERSSSPRSGRPDPSSTGRADREDAGENDAGWLAAFAAATGVAMAEDDLAGVLRQIGPLKQGLERMKALDLRSIELPLWFVPPGTPPGIFARD